MNLVSPLFTMMLTFSCAHKRSQYETTDRYTLSSFRKVALPFPSGTHFFISQGAFGSASHAEPGNQYSWDFDVPLGTPVLAVEDGVVIDVHTPPGGSGCNAKYSNNAYNIKIENLDGAVAQYVHISPKVSLGESVKRGQVIATTAANGFICVPQLHFGIYKSRLQLYDSSLRQTLPLFFDGIEGGLAKEGLRLKVP